MIHNPKFDKHLRDKIDIADNQRSKPRHGIVTAYDRENNTATVLLSDPTTDVPTDVLTNVPCPVMLGIQMVAPEPGRPCVVIFKGASESIPYITHFFNHRYGKYDYDRQTQSSTGVPNFMLQ